MPPSMHRPDEAAPVIGSWPETSMQARLALLLPLLAVCVLYWPALGSSFQFDDWNVIVHEPRVHSLAAWWNSMPGIRPLLKLTYALNYLVSDSPAPFRLVNVLVHALNAAMVCWLLGVRGLRAGLTRVQAWQAGLLAALIFGLHPVQTEAVTYISGRSSSLAAFFCLVSACCWVRSEESASASFQWLIGCYLAFMAAVATKETALVLPFVLWLYSADRPIRDNFRRLLPVMGVMLVLVLAALSLPRYRHLLEFSLDTRSIGSNLLTQARALLYLSGQLVRPGNANADPQLPVIHDLDATGVALCLLWATLAITGLLLLRKAVFASFAILWFLLWLAPTNSLLPRLDVANDRQLYLALIGPAWFVAVQMTRWPAVARGVVAALLIVLLAHATFQRNRIYQTEIAFWEDTLVRNRENARAANNLGMAYAMDCRLEEAEGAFELAVELEPHDYHARINLRFLREGTLPGVDAKRCATLSRRSTQP